ncbi:heavy metal translocating P-type ATPase [Herbiconiux sp. KACC 21604]|uniref:heavy metal translocating P-type ATPase n=1 Tax=unclassified Herbiconiux TaxID=2618217 RepID=UPI001491DB40|nr:heavy metal translocating P-type ATPase [Herbiconiux sp. SALV-R1]QJU54634.1 heavy metal translocating P-type ATPase [Herbiconiux sp. SALV-R1]WPO85729.1 heavy metal translocating P-type ATPase [Herbiconiux sp. KACC 21604]
MSALDVELEIGGMTCASCANRVERKLNKLPGVEATVNYATEKARVRSDGVDARELVAAVKAAGYTATLPAPPAAAPLAAAPRESARSSASGVDPARASSRPSEGAADPTPAPDRGSRMLLRRLVVSGALALPVALMSMVPALQFTSWQWVALVLATPVVVWGAWPFHRAAAVNARHGAATMDTLISVGVLAAYGWSLYALVFGSAGEPGMHMSFSLIGTPEGGSGEIYLEVASAVTVFILAGRYIESRAKRSSAEALRALLSLAAKDASVLRDGVEQRVPASALRVGDLIVVRPGEKIAADGVVVEGASAVDTSLVTGESVPVEVSAGSRVIGATLVVGGRLVVEATRVGADTELARMGRLLEEAQTGKAQVQRLADRVSGVFVPVVMVLAVVAFAGWLLAGASLEVAFTAGVATLIIACPCALGLATPTALLVGTGRGSQLGILLRGPQVLEQTRRVDTIVLDKTGTVTTGEMSVREVVPATGARGASAPAGVSAADLIAIAAAVEEGSEHPVARAIVRAAATDLPRVEGFEAHTGFGVQGVVGGRAVVAGRLSWLAEEWRIDTGALAPHAAELEADGATVVAVAAEGVALGLIAVADTVKITSARAIEELRALGLTPVLLTGDNPGAAAFAARAVGIDEVRAGVTPAGKLDAIRSLQREGRVVSMAGDGVNDAAALAAADLGLAMGDGTDAAIAAGDITIVGSDLRTAATAIRLARATLGIIKGNLFWAFAYNAAAIPLAMLGLLNPLLAGAAMAFSSVFVVTNSLRLRRFR